MVASPTASETDSIKGCWLLLLEEVEVFVQSVYSFEIVRNISCGSQIEWTDNNSVYTHEMRL